MTQSELAEKLKRKTELICTLIFCPQVSDETIRGERKLVRLWCEQFIPDRLDLYDLIYESRFDRLIEQFRKP